ncbi:MAG: bifunctional 4-hydroxy-2-oxoglutarate aldolase/2-dehydro-3-deoxy-phosphogluconate aldolase [Burkholderiales bacterium]|nr:bifunctional 4-hydroxy-2-oxoglutarate aldolase/2-dehydro-3-deoxy-phosphogluconate aldolase [Burkholderiales bacterium]
MPSTQTTMPALPAFQSRVVPVIALHDVAHAVPLAEALLAGGIDVMEITLRTPQGLACIAAVARAVPAMYLGAGTVTQAADVQRVIDAGARFALSPGCTPALVDAVRAAQLPFVPGVMTPSEVMTARDHGFRLMKLFPAAQAGGLAMLQALSGPLADVRFCPTGGISPDNLASFLRLPNVAMVGGSWLTPADALAAHDWPRITLLARAATQAAAIV